MIEYRKKFEHASEPIRFQGNQRAAEAYASRMGLTISYENNGFFILTKPCNATIFQVLDGKIIDQVNPRGYIFFEHPEYERLTEKRVQTLCNDLNEGIVDFYNVKAYEE